MNVDVSDDARRGGAPFSVLIVCEANRCRSPLAEHLLRAACAAASLDWQISSAGLRATDGSPMEPHAAAVLAEHRIDPDGWTSRRLRPRFIAAADLVLTAEVNQRRAVVSQSPGAVQYTFPLLQFAQLVTSTPRTVPIRDGWEFIRVAARGRGLPQPRGNAALDLADPIGQPLAAYRECARVISEAVSRLMHASGLGHLKL